MRGLHLLLHTFIHNYLIWLTMMIIYYFYIYVLFFLLFIVYHIKIVTQKLIKGSCIARFYDKIFRIYVKIIIIIK